MFNIDLFEQRNNEFIDFVKSSLYKRHPDIFDRLDFSNDDIYKEPILIYYLSQNDNVFLDSVIYGYEAQKKSEILVFSNKSGVVCLPKVGYLKTEFCEAELLLKTTMEGICLVKDDIQIAFEFEPFTIIESDIIVERYFHPFLEKLFTKMGNDVNELYIQKKDFEQIIQSLSVALSIIREASPPFYYMLCNCGKKILLFSSTRQNSFATMDTLGQVYLNICNRKSIGSFIEQVSHEFSHVLFFILTFKTKKTLFKHPYNTLIKDVYAPLSFDTNNTIYLKFHGAFTFVAIVKNLIKGIESSYNNRDLYEMEGRFVYNWIKFSLALKPFEDLSLLKDEGLEWYEFMKNQFLSSEEVYKKLSTKYSFLKQNGYDFDWELFYEENENVISSEKCIN